MTALHPRFPSILHALLAQAERGPDGSGVTLIPHPGSEVTLRADALVATAARYAAALAEHGVGPGDRVVLCLPTGPAFVAAFFGSQLLGAVPTAVALPMRLGGKNGTEDHIRDLVAYLKPAAIVTTNRLSELGLDGDALYARAATADAPAHPLRLPAVDDLAFIQCTSGSTGRPKGVMISHANLAANLEQMAGKVAWGRSDTTVSWAPLYHDMGLITGLLTPVYTGGHAVLMPTARFLRAPGEWLKNINTYRGTIGGGPNFAYGYVTARVKDEELDGVDLSSWRIAICGAEPIQPKTVRGFLDRFARWGLDPGAFTAAYGMAEAGLAITSPPVGVAYSYDSIDRQAAVLDGKAIDIDERSTDALLVTDCGVPLLGSEVRIVDDNGLPLADDRIGHVQFRGPSRTVGYFDLPDETAACVDEPDWWKTGDIGYLRDGSLRITSRAKDLIIIRGANYFPSDFEQAAETVPGVRLGAVVAVGHRPDDADSEELHLFVEAALTDAEQEPLRQAVRGAVSTRTGVVPAGIHLVPKFSIPKTTSGKLQRAKALEVFPI
jgi:acyl-CoA synthetase (AMP-forming)/AMP-acid ligase II